MAKAIAGVLPWAVAGGAAGGAIWWLLSTRAAAGPWVLAVVLLGHGLVHAMFLVPPPSGAEGGPRWPFDLGRTWPATSLKIDPRQLRIGAAIVIAIVVGGCAAAALSTVGVLVPSSSWREIVALAAVASAALLILFFDAQLVVGLGIDAVLLWAVAAQAWAP